MTTAGPTPGEPGELDALAALAHQEHRAGRLTEAAAAYRKILALRPDLAAIYLNLAAVLVALGNLDEAAAQFERALALEPGLVQAHNSLGRIFWQQGKLDPAVSQLQQVIALRPNYVDAYNNLGNLLKAQGQLDQARAHYEHAIALRPDFAEARNNLGNLLLSQGKLDEAAAQYQRALAHRPDLFQAYNGLGDVFHQQRKFDQAIAQYQRAIALRPDSADTHNNLGAALARLDNLDAAEAHCERALVLNPGLFRAHNNLGNIFRKQGKLDLAEARFHRALALNPAYPEAHKNLGSVRMSQGKTDEAAECYEQALALRPDYIDARMGLAVCHLVRGDFERGWAAYEARLGIPGFLPQPNLLRWTGEPLAGRSLLFLAEQGLGDTLHFIRYARLLKEQGARIVLAAPAALGRLLALHPDVDELFILGAAEELPRCDFFLPLLSAPGAFHSAASTIPSEVPYLWADPGLTEQWRQELTEIDGFKIGIAWQGARDFGFDPWRSIPLAQFAPLARLPGVRLVSLQKGFGSEQVATVDFPVLDLSGRLDAAAGAFMDTAAVIRNLDLVLTADTAIGHLAGALGAPVWLALQFSADWRWLRDRDDTPWYPTMRLFRQTTIGEWPDVFERMADAVQKKVSGTLS